MATLVLPLLLHKGTTQETSSWCGVSAACRALALQKQQGPSWSSASALQPSAEPGPCPSHGTKPPLGCWGLLGWWQELLMFLWTMTTSWDPGSDFHFCSLVPTAWYPRGARLVQLGLTGTHQINPCLLLASGAWGKEKCP